MSKLAQFSRHSRDLLDIYSHAIKSIQPEKIISNSVNIRNNILTIHRSSTNTLGDINIDISNSNVHIIGGGKSVVGMANGLAHVARRAQMSHTFTKGFLSLPIGLKSKYTSDKISQELLNSVGVQCMFGAENNLPDENSVIASKRLLDNIDDAIVDDQKSKRRSLFLLLLGGGGSACLSSPRYISLDEKLSLIKYLVQKGADIVDLNKVRRYFSNIKGGELAHRLMNSKGGDVRLLTLILSDVVGDPIEYIASGPSYLNANPDSYRDTMLSTLSKFSYPNLDLLKNKCREDITPRLNKEIEGKLINIVIGNNALALNAAMKKAESLGLKVQFIGSDLMGSSEDTVKRIVNFAKNSLEDESLDKLLILAGGEVTVNKKEDENWGKGGRAQETAMDYLIHRLEFSQDSLGEDGVDIFLAAGTDGQDGPTDAAGCISSMVGCSQIGSPREVRIEDLMKAKRSHDSYNFWTEFRPEWIIKTGLTETNVMDLYMLMLCNTQRVRGLD